MEDIFARTKLIFGDTAMQKLEKSRVAVFGLGGVGGNAVEALVRSGVGNLDIFDNDTVSVTNLNRQIAALHSTVGCLKTDVIKKRACDINPNIKINAFNVFYMPENSHLFDFSQYDYIVDAIDTVTAKIELIMQAQKVNTPIISSMGTGNKLNPAMLEVSDIYKTSVCPLARVMRHELKKRGVKKLKVVYSKEVPFKPDFTNFSEKTAKKNIPASTAFVPPVAGILAASEVIKDLCFSA